MRNAIGYAAALLTTVAFVPQVAKAWRTRRVEDISLRMYALFSAGVILWMAYGFSMGSLPVLLANGVTLLLTLAILVAKLRYRNR